MPILKRNPTQNPSCHNSTTSGPLAPGTRRGNVTRDSVGAGEGRRQGAVLSQRLSGTGGPGRRFPARRRMDSPPA
jgi:hypothetical protein